MKMYLQKLALGASLWKRYHVPTKKKTSGEDMGILEDFYMGEVKPWEDFGFSDDPVYKMNSRKIEQLEHSLMVGRSKKEQKVCQELKHLRTVQSNMELERMFLYAFRMGAEFALDLFSE